RVFLITINNVGLDTGAQRQRYFGACLGGYQKAQNKNRGNDGFQQTLQMFQVLGAGRRTLPMSCHRTAKIWKKAGSSPGIKVLHSKRNMSSKPGLALKL
ncbi:MAG: hypothetical protein AWU57_5205, partial [Marinobacter sp. T13-3]